MNRLRTVCIAIALANLLTMSGCVQGARFDYRADAGSYSMAELGTLAQSLDRPDYMGRPVSESKSMRHEALVSLRKQGDDESELANLITEQFPADTRAVPFWGGKGVVDGRDAWIIAEAWGLKNGTLDKVRLWAFDRDSRDVITSTVSD